MAKSTLKLLIIDDDEDDYLITAHFLKQCQHIQCEISWVTEHADGLQALLHEQFDLALIDYYLNETTGVSLISEVIAQGCEIPLILFTGQDAPELDQAGLDAGAADYMVKGTFDAEQLERVIRYALSRKQTENELKRSNIKNKRLAEYDGLTGLANRRHFDRLFPQILERIRRNGLNLALMFLDLDGFKGVNDKHGHDVGDELLRQTAERLQETLRRTDFVFRFGGDEFTVIVEGDLDPKKIARVAQKIATALSQSFFIEQTKIDISASIGIATSFRCGTDIKTLIKCADTAMYAAKRCSEQRYQFFTPELNERTTQSMRHTQFIRDLLANDELQLCYQPMVCLDSGDVLGLDALPGAIDADGNAVQADQLLAMAQDAGLVSEFGQYVFLKAMQQCQDLLTKTELHLTFRLPDLFSQRLDLVSWLETELGRYSLKPEQMQLAFGQETLMDDPEFSIIRLRELQDYNINILLDDFGIGHLALGWLPLFPVTGFRLADQFMLQVPDNFNNTAIVKSIIDIGRNLNQPVYIPTITDQKQLELVKNYGAYAGQGDVCAKSLAVDELGTLL